MWERRGSRRAVLLLPALTTRAEQYWPIARLLNFAGHSVAVLSLPDHDERTAPGRPPGGDLISANLGLTLAKFRQAVLDARRALDILEERGYREFSILGVSVGSCVGAMAAAHDSRITRACYTFATLDLAEPMWTGSLTQHVRAAVEPHLGFDDLRACWRLIGAGPYLSRCRPEVDTLIISGARDDVCPPRLTRDLVAEIDRLCLNRRWRELSCGHASIVDLPHVAVWLHELFHFFGQPAARLEAMPRPGRTAARNPQGGRHETLLC